LEIAKPIQLSLLPDAPLVLPTAELAGVCVPASHVGSDYFDFFHTSDAVDIVIADVSGHSVGAALIMAEARSTLRAATRKVAGVPVGPAQVLRDLNELLYDDLTKAELFITIFYLKYLPDTRILKYANAGHNKARCCYGWMMRPAQLLMRKAWCWACGVKSTSKRGAWGWLPAIGYCCTRTELLKPKTSRGRFSVSLTSASAYRTLPPEALIGALLAEVRAFCGETPIRDDISMLTLQVR
jgi:phosphoserine phosphatase RsbU/P